MERNRAEEIHGCSYHRINLLVRNRSHASTHCCEHDADERCSWAEVEGACKKREGWRRFEFVQLLT